MKHLRSETDGIHQLPLSMGIQYVVLPSKQERIRISFQSFCFWKAFQEKSFYSLWPREETTSAPVSLWPFKQFGQRSRYFTASRLQSQRNFWRIFGRYIKRFWSGWDCFKFRFILIARAVMHEGDQSVWGWMMKLPISSFQLIYSVIYRWLPLNLKLIKLLHRTNATVTLKPLEWAIV